MLNLKFHDVLLELKSSLPILLETVSRIPEAKNNLVDYLTSQTLGMEPFRLQPPDYWIAPIRQNEPAVLRDTNMLTLFIPAQRATKEHSLGARRYNWSREAYVYSVFQEL